MSPHRGTSVGSMSCFVLLCWWPDSTDNDDEGWGMGQLHGHQDIIDTFVDITSLSVDLGLGDSMLSVLEACCNSTDVEEGVLLESVEGNLEVAAATSAAVADLFAKRHTHGPKTARECMRANVPVSRVVELNGFVVDPYLQRLVELGVTHENFFPMRLRGTPTGVVVLLGKQSPPLDPVAVSVTQGIADSAAAVLRQIYTLEHASALVTQLQQALDHRLVIEQAKGVLSERWSVDVAHAFQRMRKIARRDRRAIGDVAREIVASHNGHDPLIRQDGLAR